MDLHYFLNLNTTYFWKNLSIFSESDPSQLVTNEKLAQDIFSLDHLKKVSFYFESKDPIWNGLTRV